MTHRIHCETDNDTTGTVRQVTHLRHCETGYDSLQALRDRNSPRALRDRKWFTADTVRQIMAPRLKHCDTGNQQYHQPRHLQKWLSSWWDAYRLPLLSGFTRFNAKGSQYRNGTGVPVTAGSLKLVWTSNMSRRSSLINCCHRFDWLSTLFRNYTRYKHTPMNYILSDYILYQQELGSGNRSGFWREHIGENIILN